MQWTKQGFEEYQNRVLTSDDVLVVADRQLGRRAKSKTRARKAYRGLVGLRSRCIPEYVFMPPRTSTTLSADCLGVVSDREMAQIAIQQLARVDEESRAREEFYGWYVLTVQDIDEAGCTLRISPTAENRYHADIELPVDPALDPKSNKCRAELKRIANDLSTRATFIPYGDWTDDVNLGQG